MSGSADWPETPPSDELRRTILRIEAAAAAEALDALRQALIGDHYRAGYDDDLAWSTVAEEWALTLSRRQRRALLRSAISACAAEDAVEMLDAALREITRSPTPAFTTVTAEARDWVRFATLAEIKIYLLACFNAIPKLDRVNFLAAAQRSVLR